MSPYLEVNNPRELATMFPFLRRISRKEDGAAFILVLILLLVGGLIIAPLLAFMGTGLKTGQVFEAKTRTLYAADAGIEDGLWNIKYDKMQAFPDYDELAFYQNDPSYEWSYDLAEDVNNNSVNVTIQNTWIPADIPAPSPGEAAGVITCGKLTINGTRAATNSYRINLTFTPANEEEKENLRVQSIGVYLPPGYSYVSGSSNLEEDPLALWYSVPNISGHAGNEAVIWSFGGLKFADLPPVGSTETATITFEYTSTTEINLAAVSWIKTSGVAEIPFAWDLTNRIYHITSATDEGSIDSYVMLPGGENLNIFGGALVADGDISLKKDSNVSGDIIYEGDFSYQEPFTHTDGEILNIEVEFPSQEENENFADGVKQDAQDMRFWVGDYNIGIGNGVDVIDLGPIYISQDLNIAKDNTINFKGPVFVGGNIDMDKDAEFTGAGIIIAVGNIYLAKTNDFGGSQDSLLMSLNGNITFKKEAEISAIIYAPSGNITFDKSGVVNGSVIGTNIQADKDGSFTQNYAYYDGIQLPGYTPGSLRTLNWKIN